MVELLKANKYYGFRAKGWVLLVNGQPYHFTGKTAKRDAEEAMEKFEERF